MSFKSLVSALSEQRQEIKQALTLFPYFDTWDSKVIAECCQQSKIIEFSPDEIILGSGTSNSHMTFFILEGVCKIIHHILVRVKVDSYGRISYNLYKPEEVGQVNGQSNGLKYASLLFNQKHDFQREDGQEKDESDKKDESLRRKSFKSDSNHTEQEMETKIPEEDEPGSEMTLSETEKNNNFERNLETENERIQRPKENEKVNDGDDEEIEAERKSEDECSSPESPTENEDDKKGDEQEQTGSTAPEIPASEIQDQTMRPPYLENEAGEDEKTVENGKKENVTFEPDHHLKVLDRCKAKSNQVRLVDEKYSADKPKDVKSLFVQVALFYKGACFGLEENMKDTFIMSATKVKCLRIPRRFLLQHNPCNIWNRIRLFFSLYLPSEKQIFEYVKSHRNWNNMKRKKSEEITSMKRIPNYILCAEVPYSIRLQGMPG